MAKHFDEKMLHGFVEEARSYLPQIHEGIDKFQQDATQREALEETYRYVHTIKGASAMIGLPILSQLAAYAEDSLERLVNEQASMDLAHATWLHRLTEQLESYLTGLLEGHTQQRPLVMEVVQAFRRFKNLPHSGDDAAVQDLLDADTDPTATDVPLDDEMPVEGTFEEAPASPSIPEAPLDAIVAAIDREVHTVYGQATAAARQVPSDRQGQGERYVLFTLAGSRYAVPVPAVLEIGRIPTITQVPNVPTWMRGVINLRGEILSVIDFRLFLGLEVEHQGEQDRLLVVKTAGDEITTSLIVDQVMGIVPLSTAPMEPPPASPGDKAAPYLSGVYEHEGQALAVFDLERFLLASEVRQFE